MTLKAKYDLRCLDCGEEFLLRMKGSDYRAGKATYVKCDSSNVQRDFSKGHDVKVLDHTGTRKGYYNSKEGYHR